MAHHQPFVYYMILLLASQRQLEQRFILMGFVWVQSLSVMRHNLSLEENFSQMQKKSGRVWMFWVKWKQVNLPELQQLWNW